MDDDSGVIDWPTLAAAPTDFAYIRATVGAEARDPRFAANWRGAGEAGMRRGIVHDYSLCQLAAERDRAELFDAIVVDEAQHVKNVNTAAAKALRSIPAAQPPWGGAP